MFEQPHERTDGANGAFPIFVEPPFNVKEWLHGKDAFFFLVNVLLESLQPVQFKHQPHHFLMQVRNYVTGAKLACLGVWVWEKRANEAGEIAG